MFTVVKTDRQIVRLTDSDKTDGRAGGLEERPTKLDMTSIIYNHLGKK